MTKKEKLLLFTEYEKAFRARRLWKDDDDYMEEKSRHEFLVLGNLISKFIPDLDEQAALLAEASDKLKDYLPDYA